MKPVATLTDKRMQKDLETELQALISTVRESLSELLATPGDEVAQRFLSEAPVENCVRLADTWAVAEAVGMPLRMIKARLSQEDQLVLEIVTGIYSAGFIDTSCTSSVDLPELVRLVDELALEEMV